MHCHCAKCIPFPQEQIAKFGAAKAHGFLQHGRKDRLKIAGRSGNNLEHFGGRGLLLQRGSCSAVRCFSASNNRTFSIAITAWSAKVVTSSISRSAKGSARPRASAITPIGSPSRIRGTPIIERTPPVLASSFFS